MNKVINFFKQSINNNSENYINNLLSERNIDNPVSTLEKTVKNKFGSNFVLAVNSGTSALHLAMCTLGFKRGDKVICSINSFPSIPETVRHFDSETIFIDIEKETYNMDLGKLEDVLKKNKSKKLKAIVITFIAGQIINLNKIYKLAKEYKIYVIQDATNAMGYKHNGEYIGNKGDITIFNFAPHLCNPIANAGLLVTNNEQYYEKAKTISYHGLEIGNKDIYGNVNYIYNIIDIGWKYDLGQLDASFCLSIFEDLDKNIEKRREIASIYKSELSGLKNIKIKFLSNEHIYTSFIVEVLRNRDYFASKLKEKGIDINVQYMPIHLTKYYKNKYSMKVYDYPNALDLYHKVMSIPIYSSLKLEEVQYICNSIKEIEASY